MSIRSLFTRMRVTHWVGIVLLLANAWLFTDSMIGSAVQIVVALVILIHDLDERRWGMRLFGRVSSYLAHLSRRDLTVSADVDTRFSEEFHRVMQVAENLRHNIDQTLSYAKAVTGRTEANSRQLLDQASEIGRDTQGIQTGLDSISNETAGMQQRMTTLARGRRWRSSKALPTASISPMETSTTWDNWWAIRWRIHIRYRASSMI